MSSMLDQAVSSRSARTNSVLGFAGRLGKRRILHDSTVFENDDAVARRLPGPLDADRYALEPSRDNVGPATEGLEESNAVNGPTIAHCTAVNAVSINK
jgi:hypothetical protein